MHRAARLLSPVLLALAALLLLAWITSQLGIDVARRGSTGQSHTVSIAGGMFIVSITNGRAPELTRDTIRISTGRVAARTSWKLYTSNPTATEIQLPILYPLAAVVLMFLAVAGIPWLRRRTRLRRGLCLRCAYPRPPGDAPCSECGTTHASALTLGATPNVLRNAGLTLFAFMLIVACSSWFIAHTDRRYAAEFQASQFDYAAYLSACEPRLTGAVRIAAPGQGPTNLAAMLSGAKPGDTIVLLPGRHELGQPSRRKVPTDLLILGCGRSTTTLTGQFDDAVRVRIENLTVDCNDDVFLDLRSGGTVALRRCDVGNYNSGAGGSNAVYGGGTVLLVEGCTFDGTKGRAAGPMNLGNAFDLRGENRLYCRDTVFSNNREVLRSASCIFDRCTITAPRSPWVYSPGPAAYVRQLTISPVPGKSIGIPFTEAIDDLAPLQRLATRGRSGAWTDPVASRLAKDLGVRSTPRFWQPLLLHPNPEVRALAAAQLKLPPVPAPSLALADALQQLSAPVLPTNLTLAVLSRPAEARPALQELLAAGTSPQQPAAAALLQLLDLEPSLPEMVRAGNLPANE